MISNELWQIVGLWFFFSMICWGFVRGWLMESEHFLVGHVMFGFATLPFTIVVFASAYLVVFLRHFLTIKIK